RAGGGRMATMTASSAGLLLGLTVVAVVASTLGGCRSPSTAPNVHGIAGPDASASTVSKVHGAVGPDAQADPNAELRAYAQLSTGEYFEYQGEVIRLTKRYDDWDT